MFAGGCAGLGDPDRFAALKDTLYRKEWVVYAKPPFGGPGAVFDYLGRYTHRVAISNQRLIASDHRGVTFHTKDGKTATLAPLEFIRRFLMHVLPKGYTKIRHFGLLAPGNVNNKLVRARELLETMHPLVARSLEAAAADADARLERIVSEHETPATCPCCGIGRMVRSRVPPGALVGRITRRDTS